MAGSSFGVVFRVTTAGESHGPGNVVIVEGCPAGLALSEDDLRPDLARRRPGQSRLVSQRDESDEPEILSGVYEGRTTGTPIAVLVRNRDAKSRDYDEIEALYRPGHADYTYDAKYGRRDPRGGGRASARETVSRVAAGAIAKKLLHVRFGARVLAYVTQVGDVVASIPDPASVTLEAIERSPDGSPNLVRCPDPIAAAKMVELVERVRKEQDSIGGVAEIVAIGVPPGLGEPVFDKLKADLAKALFSLPAVMGVEIGSGFACAAMRGSEHNDPFLPGDPRALRTDGNDHGGTLGGISSGMPIVLRAAIKPTSSIPKEQPTVDVHGEAAVIRTKGRHDPCVALRFPPMAEAMVAIVLADHALRSLAAAPLLPAP
jgi:chorismate synthase